MHRRTRQDDQGSPYRIRVSPSDIVVRFVVIASDGRRSEVWRAWTGSKQPTDELYIALRSEAGDGVKASIHGDGYRQHGPTKPLRVQLREGDAHALDRWRREDVPNVLNGVRFEYFVQFPTQDLTHPVDDADLEGVVTIGAADPDKAICVAVFVAEPGSDVVELEALCFASLGRRSGGGIYFVAFQVPYRPIVVPDGQRSAWQMTPHDGPVSERFVFFTGPSPDEPRGVVELATDLHSEMRGAPVAPQFNGEVHPWYEVPVEIAYEGHLCGLLRCAPGKSASLFVDTASRCNVARLAQDANKLVDAWKRGDIDAGWDPQSDGSWFTGLHGKGHGGYPTLGRVSVSGREPEN